MVLAKSDAVAWAVTMAEALAATVDVALKMSPNSLKECTIVPMGDLSIPQNLKI